MPSKVTIKDIIRQNAGYYYSCEGYSRPMAYIAATIDLIGKLWGSIACKIKGHEWIDDSWGNSESGGMSCYCARCGEGHRTILY